MRGPKAFIAVGQMSGTSRDGLDTAVVEIRGSFPDNKITMIHAETLPYDRRLRRRLSLDTELDAGKLSAVDFAAMHFALGGFFAAAATGAIARAGLRPEEIDAIGCHGQTLYHHPPSQALPRGRRLPGAASTLQVGSGAAVAALSGVTTVTDFRSGDIAVGGEGAPLVPIYDYVVLRSPARSRVALNIGGIANVTAIPRGASLRSVTSFDTGPGNCMIDTAARLLTGGRLQFDRDGRWSRRGIVDEAALRSILGHPYFRKRPPKSTGWEEFGVDYTRRIVRRIAAAGADRYAVLRTVTEATAESIARALDRFVAPTMAIDDVIVTGGGARNLFLVEILKRRLAPARLDRGEAFGVDSRYKEAAAFAFLAYLRIKGIPANIQSQREGLRPVVLGAVYPGRSRRHAVRLRG